MFHLDLGSTGALDLLRRIARGAKVWLPSMLQQAPPRMTKTQRAKKAPRFSTRSFFTEIGAPSLFVGLGIGIALVGPENFWPGIICAVLGVLFMCTLSVHYWRREGWLIGAFTLFLPFSIAVLLSWITFRPEPLTTEYFIFGPGNYGPTTLIGGAPWPEKAIETDVDISNASDHPYTNADFFITTDIEISHVAVESTDNTCNIKPIIGIGRLLIEKIHFMDGRTEVSRPFDWQPGKPLPLTTPMYRIHCDRLLNKSSLRIFMATVREMVRADDPNVRKSEPSEPKWLFLHAEYEAGGRVRSKSEGKCFISACTDLPTDVEIERD